MEATGIIDYEGCVEESLNQDDDYYDEGGFDYESSDVDSDSSFPPEDEPGSKSGRKGKAKPRNKFKKKLGVSVYLDGLRSFLSSFSIPKMEELAEKTSLKRLVIQYQYAALSQTYQIE